MRRGRGSADRLTNTSSRITYVIASPAYTPIVKPEGFSRMIVEFVGPAGSGKTTFAHALCYRLREDGYPARVVLSHQPARRNSPMDAGGIIAAAQRVARAMATPLAMACQPFANAVNFRISASLVRTLPPQNAIWLIRFSQYVLRLTRAWEQSLASEEIVIFDQAFVQAVSSLALFNGTADEISIARALDLIPMPDLVVRIDAPQRLREDRLNDRLRHLSFAERLFEASLNTNLQSAPVIERICSLLEARGRSIIEVNASERRSLGLAIHGIERQILGKLSTQWNGYARRSSPRV